MSIEKRALERILDNYYMMSEEHYGGMESREYMDFEIVENALKKSVPELVKRVEYNEIVDGRKQLIHTDVVCPRCGKLLQGEGLNYCPYCGQRLYDIKQI